MYGFLADLTVAVHVAYVGFVVVGAFLILAGWAEGRADERLGTERRQWQPAVQAVRPVRGRGEAAEGGDVRPGAGRGDGRGGRAGGRRLPAARDRRDRLPGGPRRRPVRRPDRGH